MDPITLALIVGLGGGVVGGAVSQFIAGYYKTHGDTRLLNAAAENAKAAELRWEREQQFEREKLLAEERRLLFIKSAHAFQRMREHLVYREEERLKHGPEEWQDAVTRCADTLFEIETEVQILAPSISPNVRDATRHARAVRDAGPKQTEADIERAVGQFRDEVREALALMREVLGSGEAPYARFDPTAHARIEARKALKS